MQTGSESNTDLDAREGGMRDLRLCLRRLRLRLRAGRGFRFRRDREQFDFKDQGRVGADVGACAAVAICKVRGDEQFPLGTDWHQLQGFRPTLNDLADREGGRLSALVGAVELLAIE